MKLDYYWRLWFSGIADSGKSTIIKNNKEFYSPEDVGQYKQ